MGRGGRRRVQRGGVGQGKYHACLVDDRKDFHFYFHCVRRIFRCYLANSSLAAPAGRGFAFHGCADEDSASPLPLLTFLHLHPLVVQARPALAPKPHLPRPTDCIYKGNAIGLSNAHSSAFSLSPLLRSVAELSIETETVWPVNSKHSPSAPLEIEGSFLELPPPSLLL